MYVLEGVCVRYRYTLCRFPYINIPSQGITHIIGENGSGKSTLLKILSGLCIPDSGEFLYKGEPITHANRYILHRESTLLLQNNHLFNRSVRDNLAYPLRIHKRQYTEETLITSLHHVGLGAELLRKYPNELSGGEKQRVALAVRLLVEAPTILLDEPTANVDRESMIIIQELIKRVSEKTKVIIVAHNALWVEELATQTISL